MIPLSPCLISIPKQRVSRIYGITGLPPWFPITRVSNTSSFTIDFWLTVNDEVDGLRIDTVKHVQKAFWPGYNKAAGVYCVGEVFDGDATYTCPYQEVMDGVLNYPM